MMVQTQLQHRQSHHEVVCIGFGPAAISLAINLRETSPDTDVVFLVHGSKSAWRPLGDLPGHVHMASNFLNDLITLENPRSSFTFIQFLHQRKLLVDFTNLGAMEPSRGLFEDYLSWCAKQFEDDVRYETEALSIEPVYSSNKKISKWNVFSLNRASGQRSIFTAERVVVFAEQEPFIPEVLSHPSLASCLVHSSRCMTKLRHLIKTTCIEARIAIIGHTQQAAELFEHLYDSRADGNVAWFFEGTSPLGQWPSPG